MRQIHPTAIVDRKAELADDVVVGAYSIIKAGGVIQAGTVIHEHSHIQGQTTIGRRCKIGPAAYVGLPPQHLKFDGANARTILGDDVIIRETASVHRSIHEDADHATRIGNRCFLMGASHVGHDGQLGEDVVLANGALLGGHCVVGDRVFVGGGAVIHQFVRIGRLAIISGNEPLSHDIPPFAAAIYRGLKGYNAIGCKRAGMSRETIHAVRSAFHCLHRYRTLPAALEAIRQTIPMLPEIQELLVFYATSKRGVLGSVKFMGNARSGRPDKVAGDLDVEK